MMQQYIRHFELKFFLRFTFFLALGSHVIHATVEVAGKPEDKSGTVATLVQRIPTVQDPKPQQFHQVKTSFSQHKQSRGKDAPVSPPEQVWPVASIILGRPGTDTMTASVLPEASLEGYLEYGPVNGLYEKQTARLQFESQEPYTITLNDLQANSVYRYRFCYRTSRETEFKTGPDYSFHTQRSPGSNFIFTIQADSHLGTDKHCEPKLYARTLLNIQNDAPDFHIDLGDTFRATKLSADNEAAVENLFLNQRNYFGLICHSVPLFLVLGNHDREWGWDLKSGPDSLSARMTRARNLFYPNPVPGGIFTGNTNQEDRIGYPANYYAWEWGDGLFIVLDIYRHTTINPKADGGSWDWTLGKTQYEWLQNTLKASHQPMKSVFLHHLHGTCRGGTEWIDFYEWGGNDRRGEDSFSRYRPEWLKPVHQLLVDYGVTAVFQGHDHIFASQSRDGIAYITCPMPGDPGYNAYNQNAFQTGETRPNSGHVRVSVNASNMTIDYVRAFLPTDESLECKNGSVAYSETLPAR